jgi:hypothetical protein
MVDSMSHPISEVMDCCIMVTRVAAAERCANRPEPEAAATRTFFDQEKAMSNDIDDFTHLDDTALLTRRAEMRAELERLPPASPGRAALTALYDGSTEEVNARARRAWSKAGKGATQ